jgi:hypothetical protein
LIVSLRVNSTEPTTLNGARVSVITPRFASSARDDTALRKRLHDFMQRDRAVLVVLALEAAQLRNTADDHLHTHEAQLVTAAVRAF